MKKIVFLLAVGCLAVSCGTRPLYNWRGYDRAVYAYLKNPTPENTAELTAVYEDLIRYPAGGRQVPPPGVYADYAYLLIQSGHLYRAKQMLVMETNLYPESKPFIDRIIKRLEE